MNRMRGSVSIQNEAAGPGVYLCVLPGDLLKIGEQTKARALDEIVTRLELYDAEMIVTVIRAAAKRGNESVVVNVDAIDLTIGDLRSMALDAVVLAVHGCRYEELLARLTKQAAELDGKGRGPVPPVGSET